MEASTSFEGRFSNYHLYSVALSGTVFITIFYALALSEDVFKIILLEENSYELCKFPPLTVA